MLSRKLPRGELSFNTLSWGGAMGGCGAGGGGGVSEKMVAKWWLRLGVPNFGPRAGVPGGAAGVPWRPLLAPDDPCWGASSAQGICHGAGGAFDACSGSTCSEKQTRETELSFLPVAIKYDEDSGIWPVYQLPPS